MKSQSVRWALVLGIVASVVVGAGGEAFGQEPPYFSLGPGWDAVFGLSTGEPYLYSGGTYTYETPIAFKGTFDTTGIGGTIPYLAYTPDYYFFYWGSVPGGEQGARYSFVPPRLDNSVTLNVDAYHPINGVVVASDSHTESVGEIRTKFRDYTLSIAIPRSMTRDWVVAEGNHVVDLAFGESLTQESIACYAIETGLPESVVEANLTQPSPK